MDKCSCLNPESIAGVLKTVYLFLEGQNFRKTCDTFLNESRVMGYAELKKAMARVLILKPSFTEVVKISHADPEKSEHQIQADLPIFMDASVQDTSSKQFCVYHGEPICINRPEYSVSAPNLAHSMCSCKTQSECKKGGVNIVQTIDNTQNDIETQRILKKAVCDEVRVAPPPPLDPELSQARKDKKINFKQTTQVFTEPNSLNQLPTDVTEKTMRPVSAEDEAGLEGREESHHARPVHSESKVSAKSDTKLELEEDEELLRTEDFKNAPSLASVKSKASAVSTNSTRSQRSVQPKEMEISAPGTIGASLTSVGGQSLKSVRQQGSIVRFDIDGRVIDPASSLDQSQNSTRENLETLEEDSPTMQPPSRASIAQASHTSAQNATISRTSQVDDPSKLSIHISETAVAESAVLDPSTGTVCQNSRTSLFNSAVISQSRKSVLSNRVSVVSTKPSTKSMGPFGTVASKHLQEGTIDIGRCLPKSHSMYTSTNQMQCVEASTEGIYTICKSVSCTPNLVERSASTRSLREQYELDYNKVKKELRSGCPSVRIILLQALRWRITRAGNDIRNDIVSDYARHDLLSLHGTPSGVHKSIIEEFLCATIEKTAANQEEEMARLVNVMASLTLGRDYLCQDESLLTKLIIPLVMDVYPYKAHTTNLTKEHLLVALQKLSLRNNMRLVMIQAGLTEYLVFYLFTHHNIMSDYCLEYCLALLMNLCLHTETRFRLKKKSKDVVRFITDFLTGGHDSCLSYLNSAMYSLFMDPDIRKDAKHEHLDMQLIEKSKSVDEETRQQMEVILDLLNMNKQSTPCGVCGCIDQDDEVDHLENELELNDPVKGDPNGEDLLRLYLSRRTSSGLNAVPLTCTCRPITPRKKISAAEKCPSILAAVAASSYIVPVEPEKKSKKHKFCWGICSKKKEDKPKMQELTVFNDEENVLASEECPRAATCCPEDVDDECIPTKESASAKVPQSRVSICSSVLAYDPSEDPIESAIDTVEMETTMIQRSCSHQTTIEEPLKASCISVAPIGNTESTISVCPSKQQAAPSILSCSSRQQNLIQQDSSALICPSGQQSSLHEKPSVLSYCSRQKSILPNDISLVLSSSKQQLNDSKGSGMVLVCSEKEDDTCIDRCKGKQQDVMSKPSGFGRSVSKQRSIDTDPNVVSHMSIEQSAVMTEEVIMNGSQQDPFQEQLSTTSCLSRQASVIKSASCGSINPSKEPSQSITSLVDTIPSESKLTLKKEASLMQSVTENDNLRGSCISQRNMKDKGVQEPIEQPTDDNKRKKCQTFKKCCAAKPKKQESNMSVNLESEVTVDYEYNAPNGVCSQKSVRDANDAYSQKSVLEESDAYSQKDVCDESYVCDPNDICEECNVYSQKDLNEKSVGTVSRHGSSKRVFAREPSSYVSPSFTRSAINNQSRQRNNQNEYYLCNGKSRQSPCVPCSAGYYTNNNPCIPTYAYPTCYREPTQYSYCNKPTPCVYSCPQNQQRTRYACDCYNNVRQFVQNTDVSNARICSTPRQLQNLSSSRNSDTSKDEINDISTPEKEFKKLESVVRESDIFCEPGANGYPNIDCECYQAVFLSRPKLKRTP